MPATEVLTEHDDGRWYVADVLDQYRDRVHGHWRVVVTYSTEPGSRYIRAEPADRCRRLAEPQQDEAPTTHQLDRNSLIASTIRPGSSWRGSRIARSRR